MKLLWLVLLSLHLLQAHQVEISADAFEADEKKMFSILKGNVLLKKGKDIVHADTLTVFFDKTNKPKKYMAEGNIRFSIQTDKQRFDGKAAKLLYNPKTLQYEVSGDAFIHEKTQNRKVYGETIIIDRINGKSSIKGSQKRPVKFIFEVEEK